MSDKADEESSSSSRSSSRNNKESSSSSSSLRSNKRSSSSSSSSSSKSNGSSSSTHSSEEETEFDRVMRLIPNYEHSMPIEPLFQPVVYGPEHAALKYKTALVRMHEFEIRKRLSGELRLTEARKKVFISAMSYYPGNPRTSGVRIATSVFHPSDAIAQSDHNSSSSSESELRSPTFLFRDLPDATNSGEEDETVSSPPRPDRLTSDVVYKTPEQPTIRREAVSFINDLSPIMDRLKLVEPYISPVKDSELVPKKNLIPEADQLPFAPVSQHLSAGEPSSLAQQTKSSSCVGGNVLVSPIFRTRQRKVPHLLKVRRVSMTRKNTKCFIKLGSTRLRASRKKEKAIKWSLTASDQQLVSSPPPSLKPIVLAFPHDLKKESKNLIKTFTEEFQEHGWTIRVQNSVDEHVTHVLADAICLELNKYLITERHTFQYVQAIGYKKYLVAMNWIEDSLATKTILKAENYEVALHADTLVVVSRISRKWPRDLFQRFAFLVAKPFLLCKHRQLEDLLAYNGADIAWDPKHLDLFCDKMRVCLVDANGFVFNQEPNKIMLKRKLKLVPCVTVHYEWIFQCFLAYNILPITSYLFEMPLDMARKVTGIPEELLIEMEVNEKLSE